MEFWQFKPPEELVNCFTFCSIPQVELHHLYLLPLMNANQLVAKDHELDQLKNMSAIEIHKIHCYALLPYAVHLLIVTTILTIFELYIL